MKLKIFLILALCLDGALGLLLWQKTRPPAPTAPDTTLARTASIPVHGIPDKPADSSTPKASQQFDWRVVESEDYRKYIANLRAIGCPEETIHDIIIADVNKLFESRRRASSKPAKKFEYWKTGQQMFAGLMDEENIKQQQALTKEKRALLKELLGVEPDLKADLAAGAAGPLEAMLDFLPAEKQTQLLELEQKYGAKVMNKMKGGARDAQDMKELQGIQKEKGAELAQLLSPQEKEEYDLRMSQTAMMMRMQLAGFEPTEQEFREIFQARKTFDDEFGLTGMAGTDKADQEKRAAAKQALDDQVKSLLGDSRFAEYERVQDMAYQSIAKAAEREGLPTDAAVKVYDMKKAAEEFAGKLRNDPSLSFEQRQSALQGIRAETEKAIVQTLGQKGFERLQSQPMGSSWLRNLSPDASQAPQKPREPGR
jgi:hypothetical protein